jgi:hypothetical protein
LSCEPLLGSVNLWECDEWNGRLVGVGIIASGGRTPDTADYPSEGYDDSYPGIDWVIVGGESGARHRQMQLGWLTSIVDQCREADVPVFVKQDSGMYPERQGRIPDEYMLKQFPASAASLEPIS